MAAGQSRRIEKPRPRILDYVTWAVLVVLVAILIVQIVNRVQRQIDDVRYGQPRMMVLTAVVGHADSLENPTYLLALNLNRQVAVLEIPAGNIDQARFVKGPYLVGADEDQTPVTLRLEQVNGDDVPDLIVSIKREEILYINDGGSFRVATAEERGAHQERLQKGQ